MVAKKRYYSMIKLRITYFNLEVTMNNSPETNYQPTPEEMTTDAEREKSRGGFFVNLSKRARNTAIGAGLAASALAGAGAKPAEAGGGDIPMVGAEQSQEFNLDGLKIESGRGQETRFLAGGGELTVRQEMYSEIFGQDEMSPEEVGRKGATALLVIGREPNYYDVGALRTSREPGIKNVRVSNVLFQALRLGQKSYAEFRNNLSPEEQNKFPVLESEQDFKNFVASRDMDEHRLIDEMILLDAVETVIVNDGEPNDLRLTQTVAENDEGLGDLKADYELDKNREPLTHYQLEQARNPKPNEVGDKRIIRLTNESGIDSLAKSERISRIYVTVNLEGIDKSKLDQIGRQLNRLGFGKDLFINVIGSRESVDQFIASMGDNNRPNVAFKSPTGEILDIGNRN